MSLLLALADAEVAPPLPPPTATVVGAHKSITPRRHITSVARLPLPMLMPSLEEQARKKRRRAVALLLATGVM